MAYKCVHCSTLYEDGSQEIVSGCTQCKSKFFFYLRTSQIEKIKNQETPELNELEKQQIEQDVREIAGIVDPETPVFLDFESVKVVKPGTYPLDLPRLFARGKPKVYQLDDGKYIIELTGSEDLKRS